MDLISEAQALLLLKKKEAKVGSYFRHWSTGCLYVILDLGKAARYTVLNHAWETVYRRGGWLKEGA